MTAIRLTSAILLTTAIFVIFADAFVLISYVQNSITILRVAIEGCLNTVIISRSGYHQFTVGYRKFMRMIPAKKILNLCYDTICSQK